MDRENTADNVESLPAKPIKLTKKGVPDKRSIASILNAKKAYEANIARKHKDLSTVNVSDGSDDDDDTERIILSTVRVRKPAPREEKPQPIPKDVKTKPIAEPSDELKDLKNEVKQLKEYIGTRTRRKRVVKEVIKTIIEKPQDIVKEIPTPIPYGGSGDRRAAIVEEKQIPKEIPKDKSILLVINDKIKEKQPPVLQPKRVIYY